MPECLWCDAQFSPREKSRYPKVCLDCCGGVDTTTYCDKHELPTIGPVCAACENEADTKARRVARNAPRLASLRAIRAQLVADFHKAWPGAEFGKAHFGMMLDGLISDLEEKP